MLTLDLFEGVCRDDAGSNPGAHLAHGMDLQGHLTATREAAGCLAGQTWPPRVEVTSSNDHTRNPNPRTRMILQGIRGLRGPFFGYHYHFHHFADGIISPGLFMRVFFN